MTQKVRIKTCQWYLPLTAREILSSKIGYCAENKKQWTSFSVDSFPMSLNHQYIRGKNNTYLDPSVKVFREKVKVAMEKDPIVWSPTGVISAVILFYGPKWLTKEHKIRRMDIDNKVKPIFDAIEKATGFPDENVWDFHVFKIPCREEELKIYLFDLGDVVEYYY